MPAKLLLVDDSITIQRVIELTLAGEGIDVVGVASRSEALARLATVEPDIVLADIGKPEPDGCALAAAIKGDARFARIPVVLMTSPLDPLDTTGEAPLNHDAVLTKPFGPGALLDTVARLLAVRTSTSPMPGGPSLPEDVAPAPVVDRAGWAAVGALPPGRATDPLDAYFDRLDAAFADLTSLGSSRGDRPGNLPGKQVSDSASDDGEEDALAAWDPELGDEPTVSAAAMANPSVAPFAPEPRRRPDQVPSPSVGGEPSSISLPDDVLDQIAARVIARMDSDAMRRLVLDTAERIVREEIERIKRTTAGQSPPTPE